jgi:flagellar protein FliO/FliZ
MLGPRHRLILLRRDEVEHLVIVGPGSETVVESGIKRGTGESFATALAAEEPKR